jgi:hypothetical protein
LGVGSGFGSGTALTCGPGAPGTPLTCGSCPCPASGLGPRPASWAGGPSDFRSGLPSTSTSGPPLSSDPEGPSLTLDGPPCSGRGSAFVPPSGRRSTVGSRAGSLGFGRPRSVAARGGPFSTSRPGTPAESDGAEGVGGWRSPTEAGGLTERPARASPSRGAVGTFGPGLSWPGIPATVSAAWWPWPDTVRGVASGSARSAERCRSGAAAGGSLGGLGTNGPATCEEGMGGAEPPLSPGSASSCVSDPGGSGGSG